MILIQLAYADLPRLSGNFWRWPLYTGSNITDHNILVATHTKSNTMHPVFRTHTWREVAVHLLDLLKVAQLFVGEGCILPVMLDVDSSGNKVQWACDGV